MLQETAQFGDETVRAIFHWYTDSGKEAMSSAKNHGETSAVYQQLADNLNTKFKTRWVKRHFHDTNVEPISKCLNITIRDIGLVLLLMHVFPMLQPLVSNIPSDLQLFNRCPLGLKVAMNWDTINDFTVSLRTLRRTVYSQKSKSVQWSKNDPMTTLLIKK